MKTYKKTIVQELPQLQIYHEEDAESPRTHMDNLGYFITCESRRNSPDVHTYYEDSIKSTGDLAKDTQNHIELIRKDAKERWDEEKIIAIYPVNRHEHGSVNYTLGTKHGFDYSNCGFYIVTDKTQKNFSTKRKDFEKMIKQELEDYSKWCNGEVYRYELYDKNGEELDAGSSFYSVEDIKSALPKEWQKEDLTAYIQQ